MERVVIYQQDRTIVLTREEPPVNYNVNVNIYPDNPAVIPTSKESLTSDVGKKTAGGVAAGIILAALLG